MLSCQTGCCEACFILFFRGCVPIPDFLCLNHPLMTVMSVAPFTGLWFWLISFQIIDAKAYETHTLDCVTTCEGNLTTSGLTVCWDFLSSHNIALMLCSFTVCNISTTVFDPIFWLETLWNYSFKIIMIWMYVISNIFVHSVTTTEENHSLHCLWYRGRNVIIVLERPDWLHVCWKSEDIFYVSLNTLFLVRICSLFYLSLKTLQKKRPSLLLISPQYGSSTKHCCIFP